jgi:acyl carrier protein
VTTRLDPPQLGSPIEPGFRDQVFASIGELLPQVLKREVPEVAEDTQLMRELGLRSATTLELLLLLEDQLDIQIEVEDIDGGSMNSVGDLADYVATHSVTDG